MKVIAINAYTQDYPRIIFCRPHRNRCYVLTQKRAQTLIPIINDSGSRRIHHDGWAWVRGA